MIKCTEYHELNSGTNHQKIQYICPVKELSKRLLITKTNLFPKNSQVLVLETNSTNILISDYSNSNSSENGNKNKSDSSYRLNIVISKNYRYFSVVKYQNNNNNNNSKEKTKKIITKYFNKMKAYITKRINQ